MARQFLINGPTRAAAGTRVAIGTNIIVTLSESIEHGTANIVLKTAAGAVVKTFSATTTQQSPNKSTSMKLAKAASVSAYRNPMHLFRRSRKTHCSRLTCKSTCRNQMIYPNSGIDPRTCIFQSIEDIDHE